jgi:hypothetical protein
LLHDEATVWRPRHSTYRHRHHRRVEVKHRGNHDYNSLALANVSWYSHVGIKRGGDRWKFRNARHFRNCGGAGRLPPVWCRSRPASPSAPPFEPYSSNIHPSSHTFHNPRDCFACPAGGSAHGSGSHWTPAMSPALPGCKSTIDSATAIVCRACEKLLRESS